MNTTRTTTFEITLNKRELIELLKESSHYRGDIVIQGLPEHGSPFEGVSLEKFAGGVRLTYHRYFALDDVEHLHSA